MNENESIEFKENYTEKRMVNRKDNYRYFTISSRFNRRFDGF